MPGGGVALIRCLPAIEALKLSDADEQIGVEIVKRAVESPLRTLANNAGVEGSVIVQEVRKRKGNDGYNVATGEYEDLVKAGVVDPKKVTRSALQNAASIAGLLLTTECLITEVPEKEKPAPPAGHGPGGISVSGRRQRVQRAGRSPVSLASRVSRLAAIDSECAHIAEELANPALYNSDGGGTVVVLGQRQQALQKERDALEAEWLSLYEAVGGA